MSEEVESEVVSSAEESEPVDLTPVVEKISELTETIAEQNEALAEQQEQQKIETETKVEEEKSTNELLEEMIVEMQKEPSEEEVQASMLSVEEQAAYEQNIEQQLSLINDNLVALTEVMPKSDIVVEGFYFVGLSVVISIAIYMFWSQISKW